MAFFGLPLWALHSPAQPLAQQPPGRGVGQSHPGQPLDDHRDALQGPHVGGEPVGQRARQQRPLDPLQLVIGDLGAAAGRAPVYAARPSRRLASGRHLGGRRPAVGRPQPGCGPGRRARRPVPDGPGGSRFLAARCRACCLGRLVDMARDASTPAAPPSPQAKESIEDIPELLVAGLLVLAIAILPGHAWDPMIATAASR